MNEKLQILVPSCESSSLDYIYVPGFNCYSDLNKKRSSFQGCTKGQKSGGAGSNAGRRRCPAAPSDLPKSGGAAAPPAPPLGASLHSRLKCLGGVPVL